MENEVEKIEGEIVEDGDFTAAACYFKEIVDRIKKMGGKIRIDHRGLVLIDKNGGEYVILRS